MKPSLMATFGTLYREPSESDIIEGLASLKKTGTQCAQCGKAFTAARKVRGFIAYQNATTKGLVESRYPLCRPCAQRLKDHPLEARKEIAQKAYLAARTLLEPVGGTA